MSIMGPPKIGKAQRSVLIDLKIESLRLRKLLKSLGKLKALHDDGRDKMSGEYILDYHYVENLAEQAMETAGAIAFDAGVIAGDGGNELFDLLDTQRERAQNLRQAQDDTPSPSSRIDLESEAPPAREPEYQMLDRTLDWIGGGRDDTRETLNGFARHALDHALATHPALPLKGLPAETVDRVTRGIRNTIQVVDVDGSLAPPGETGDVQSPFLRWMLAGITEAEDSGGTEVERSSRTWLAVANTLGLSLRLLDTGVPYRLEADLGHPGEEGLLFLRLPAEAVKRIPPGFRVQHAPGYVLAWLVDPWEDAVANTLGRLGPVFFA